MARLAPTIITPANVGINGATLASARDSNWIDVSAFNQCTIEIQHTRSAATDLSFKVEVTANPSSPGTTEIAAIKTGQQTAGSGVVNFYEETFTIPSVSASRAHFIPIPMAYPYIRIKGLTGTSGGASDTVIVKIHLWVN